jgi:hypothetical protein
MSITESGFVLMVIIAVLFMAATVASRTGLRPPIRHQTGDSSLSAHSVTWLGAIALMAAVLICLI